MPECTHVYNSQKQGVLQDLPRRTCKRCVSLGRDGEKLLCHFGKSKNQNCLQCIRELAQETCRASDGVFGLDDNPRVSRADQGRYNAGIKFEVKGRV